MNKVLIFASALFFFGLTSFCQNPIGCYPLNGNADDYSGEGNAGIYTGSLYNKDRFGNHNSSVHTAPGSVVQIPISRYMLDEFTYSVWCKLDALPGSEQFYSIISIGGEQADHAIMVGNSQSYNYIGFGFGSITEQYVLNNCYSGSLPVVGKWYHLVVTRNNTELRLFVDETLICSKQYINQSAGYEGSVSGIIGARGSSVFQAFIGDIDDVRIYESVLDPVEVYGDCLGETNIVSIKSDQLEIIFDQKSRALLIPSDVKYAIYSVSGQQIGVGKSEGIVNVSQLLAGIYIVLVETIEGTQLRKKIMIH